MPHALYPIAAVALVAYLLWPTVAKLATLATVLP